MVTTSFEAAMSHTWGEWTPGMMDVPESTASVSRTSTAFNCSSSSVKYIYIMHCYYGNVGIPGPYS